MTRFEAAMLRPADLYDFPDQVLAEPWTPEEKFRVLRQWKDDIGQLHVATEENMEAARQVPDPVSLEQIHEAMTRLGFDPAADSPGPTKAG